MEMFVFLRMGGTMDRVTVVALVEDASGANSEEALRLNFASFQASKACCFDPNDKHRLLAVIESGFGDFLEFDRLVRSMFSQKTSYKRSLKKSPTVKTGRQVHPAPAVGALSA